MKKVFVLIFLLLQFIIPSKLVFADYPTLFFDDFNDGNLDGWNIAAGRWFIDNGNLVANQTGRALAGYINQNSGDEWDNYIFEVDINNQSGVDEGISFRNSLNGNFYEITLRHGTGAYDTPMFVLHHVQNNVSSTLLLTKNLTLLNNRWYHLKISANFENIKVWIDDRLIADINDQNTVIKKGSIGFTSWTGDVGITKVRFDNVKITSLNPPPKTPVIFIPGIGGSELKVTDTYLWSFPDGHGGTYNHTYPAGEKVWINESEAINPGDDDYFDILRMKSNGIDSEADLYLTGNIYAGSYQGAIDFLTSAGYVLNKDLFIFPYDWRKDITSTAPPLDQKIESIKTQTGSQKVDIVAHSMGGLVARNYIADSQRAGKVRKLITLGTPHLGATKFLSALTSGTCLYLEAGPFCFSIAPSEIKDVLQNMISGYELAPSQKYYEFYNGSDNNHPLPFVDNRDIDNNRVTGSLDYTQIKTMLTNLGYNTSLFIPSENFHNLDNKLNNINDVDVSIIVGSGQATTGQIIEDYYFNFAGIKIPKTDIIKVNGDETVPLFSASLIDGTKSLLGSAKIFYTNQKHSSLVVNGPAMNLVKNILAGDSNLPDKVDIKPYNFTGTGLSVHSPVLIHAYDSNNNHTGPLPNGDYETKIPSSSYEVISDAKFIWLPNDGTYTLKFEATDQGSFDFKIRDYENDINDKTILYKDVPLTTSTKAETVFDTNSETFPTLKVDQDGNGTIDLNVEKFSVLTGDANFDYIPPQISFDATPKIIWPPNNKMVDINITGNISDQNPYQTIIKVEDEYGLIEPSVTITNQINISQVIKLEASRKGDDMDGRKYVVKILATDKAGNTSLEIKEIIVPHDQGKK